MLQKEELHMLEGDQAQDKEKADDDEEAARNSARTCRAQGNNDRKRRGR